MRLFVALDLPDLLRQRLSSLYGSLPGARWRPPANLHLTLRFLGETQPHVAEEIDHALAALRARRFELSLSGIVINHKTGRQALQPATLQVGIERNPSLEHLQAKIETAVQRIGLPAEKRRFQPHVTLARIETVADAALGAWLQAHNLLRSESVPITHFTLFSSQLSKEDPVYTAEVEYELG